MAGCASAPASGRSVSCPIDAAAAPASAPAPTAATAATSDAARLCSNRPAARFWSLVISVVFARVASLPRRHEPLHAFAGEHFASVDVAFRVKSDHVQAEPLSAVFAHAAHLADDLAVISIEEPDVVVREVRDEQ